jgi:Fe-S cluster assembly scaffold protein SufB
MVAVKTYHAVASRGERYWLVHIPEIAQWTQARNLADVVPMARDLIAIWLEVPEDSFDVDTQVELPEQVRQHLETAAKQRDQAAHAQSEAARQYRAAARELKAQGLTVRDIGKALHISHQRVQQLIA